MTQTHDKSGTKFDTLNVSLKRLKTQSSSAHTDNIIHLVHKDEVTQCFPFSIFYYLVMQRDAVCDEIFPNWNKHVKIDEKGTDSKVSDKFRDAWGQIYTLAQEYVDGENEKDAADQVHKDTMFMYGLELMEKTRGAHSPKKIAVQKMGDSNLVPQVRSIDFYQNN